MSLDRTADPPATVHVCLTVDVEEEGLFGGSYAPCPATPRSPLYLRKLAPLCRDLGVPPTLLCTYPVVEDPACREELSWWRRELGAELAAHLHPWNTPPLEPTGENDPRRPPAPLMQAKLRTLVERHRQLLGAAPRSFRMGRFEFDPELPRLLPPLGIRVDSSLLPLGWSRDGPRTFEGPYDPHRLAPDLWEVPPTMTPIVAGSERLVHRLAALMPRCVKEALLERFRYVAATGVQPTMYSGLAMKLAAALHLGRGGRFLTLYLHSSELMPGGSPACPDEAAAHRLVRRLRGFLEWLAARSGVSGVTLEQAGELLTERGGDRPVAPGASS
ncbi:MAG: hypothetical protein HY815_04925 [Candidatus Riflebacteria bacterium]|nr:hypothetical protein [Candidatus Riflebacteria bacterium]